MPVVGEQTSPNNIGKKATTKKELIAFEEEVAHEWEAGKIKAPVHLMGGCEDRLIDIFRHVQRDDWVFSGHRSHLHALLKGVSPDEVRREIMAGRSICLCFPEYRFYTSAIVGGNLPIALGVAMAGERVWCFTGDMGSHTGMFHECVSYADRHELNITFVVEDNDISVCTQTEAVWPKFKCDSPRVIQYHYQNRWPHQGTGVHVAF